MAALAAAVDEVRLLSEEGRPEKNGGKGGDAERIPSKVNNANGDEDDDDDQEFDDHHSLHQRLSRNLYYGQLALPSSYKLSLPVTEICIEQFNRRSVRDAIEVKLDRLNMTRAAKVAHDTCTSPTSLVLALLYLERLRGSNPSYLNSVSSTDLFLISLMVASKYLHDDGEEDEVFNEEWAASGGMEKKDLNRLELEFLTSIDWRVHVTQAEFEMATQRLETAVVRKQLALRHWARLTYSDMVVLLQRLAATELALALKVTAVILAAYTASLATMVATCHLLNCVKLGPSAVSQSVSTIVTSLGSMPPEDRASSDLGTADEPQNFLLCKGLSSNCTNPLSVGAKSMGSCSTVIVNVRNQLFTWTEEPGPPPHHQTVSMHVGGFDPGPVYKSGIFLGASIFY